MKHGYLLFLAFSNKPSIIKVEPFEWAGNEKTAHISIPDTHAAIKGILYKYLKGIREVIC